MPAAGEHPVDAAAVDAVLTASRSLIAVATRSLGAAAEETTIVQYRALVVLASRGPQRMVDLAGALDVARVSDFLCAVIFCCPEPDVYPMSFVRAI